MAIFVAGTMAALTAEYRLGPDDRLNLRAIVWNDTARAYEAWALVNGEYVVQADGTISVPISGPVAAAGLTTTELAQDVAEALGSRGGMVDGPQIAIEVVEYRPFYVLGDVARPGAYPARPGLTAIQAVALAGGSATLRPETAATSSGIRTAGALRELRNRIARAVAREARLEAEVAGADSVTFPVALAHPDGPAATERIKQEELDIFAARKAAQERELAALQELDALLSTELEGLERKLAGQHEQIRLARERVEDLITLTERGVAPVARLTDAQRGLIDLEGKETDLQNNIYRTRQRQSENARDIIELQASRQTQATIELQKVKAELEELAVRQATLEQTLLTEGLGRGLDSLSVVRTRYSVVRAGTASGLSEQVAATDQIGPGDVLTVTVELLASTDVSQ